MEPKQMVDFYQLYNAVIFELIYPEMCILDNPLVDGILKKEVLEINLRFVNI